MYGLHVGVDTAATGKTLGVVLGRFDAMLDGYFDTEKVVVLAMEGMPGYSLGGRVWQAAERFLLGRPMDYFAHLRKRLDDDRGDDFAALSFKYSRSAEVQVVLVGDPAIIRSQVPDNVSDPLRTISLAID